MAQIIKHRRGSITQLKDVTARISELVVATGSIGDLNGPFLFVGETEGVAGAYRSVSKIYQGATAPTITVGSHGSVVDGTPFYASGNKSLYILSKDGNAKLDLTGNIEGNTISNVTITSLTGSNASVSNITGGTATITGLTNNRLVVVGSNGLLGDNANLTFDGNKFDIGQGNFQIDTTTGDIRTSGSIVMKGNITVGDSSTDNIILAGEVSSSIIPDVHNAFDLGSSSKNWRNLHVSGTAYVNILEAQSISLEGITVFEDLVVSGSSYLGTGGGDQVIVSGSIYNDALTEKRLVVVGVDGLITNYSGLTFDNDNLNLSGALEVTNIQGTGSLYLKADKNDSRYFEIYNTSTVDTHIKSNGGLSFFGDDINYLKIDDSLQTATIVGVNGVIVSSSLQVTGSLYNDQLTDNRVLVAGPNGLVGDSQYLTYDEVTLRAGAFEVDIMSGDTRMSGSLSVGGTLTVTGSATLKDNLSVSGTTTISGTTTLQDSLTVFTTSELRGAVGMNSTLDVTGSAQFMNTINVDGEATLSSATIEDLTQDRLVLVGAGGSLIDNADLTFDGTTLTVGQGNIEMDVADGDVRMSGSLTTNGLTNNGDLTVNGVLTVTGNTQLQSNLYVSGNLEVLGSSTNVIIQSQTVELDDNIIRLNAYSPFERYAGFEVMDSGSSGVSASMVWDSLSDYWMFVSSSGQSSKMIGTTAGTYGSENSLTNTYFPIATGPNTIGDSLLRYSGTTLSFNTNKFTIDSGTGDTLVSGNFTLSYSGGTDNGSKTSAIMFRNSSNVVGFVSTTETTDVLDGILGYKNSDGSLKFSTVIDGGTY
jgi:hypothetical protein